MRVNDPDKYPLTNRFWPLKTGDTRREVAALDWQAMVSGLVARYWMTQAD